MPTDREATRTPKSQAGDDLESKGALVTAQGRT